MTDEHLKATQRLWTTIKSLPFPPEIAPSPLWESHYPKLIDIVSNSPSYAEAIPQMIAYAFTHMHRRDSPHFAKIVGDYVAYLEREGTPLESLPVDIQETRFTPDVHCAQVKERRVSTGFLYHLVAALKILRHTTEVTSVLELGGGHGGIARIMKLLRPGLRYVILDLPISLCCSYLTLRGCFPNAKLVLVEDASSMSRLNDDFDFAFVPCPLIEHMRGLKFDLAVNMQSLSEMTEEAYARYMRLFQDELDLRYFYNQNRFGQHADGLQINGRQDDEPYIRVSCASMLDPHWRLRSWDLYRPDGSNGLLYDVMQMLEILVERIPPNLRCAETNRHLARQLFDEAKSRMKIDDDWYRLMWDAIRYHPTTESLAVFLTVLRAKRFPQAAAYAKLLSQLTQALPPGSPEHRVSLSIRAPEGGGGSEVVPRLLGELAKKIEEVRVLKERLGES